MALLEAPIYSEVRKHTTTLQALNHPFTGYVNYQAGTTGSWQTALNLTGKGCLAARAIATNNYMSVRITVDGTVVFLADGAQGSPFLISPGGQYSYLYLGEFAFSTSVKVEIISTNVAYHGISCSYWVA